MKACASGREPEKKSTRAVQLSRFSFREPRGGAFLAGKIWPIC
jgi:hypothetical protein